MPIAAFATLGCKVNQYETQRILDDFEAYGFQITEFNKPADVYIINTCSVTQAAERKSRQLVRKLAATNPHARVVMTGCYGEMAAIKGEIIEEAHLIVPNSQKLKTLSHVLQSFPHLQMHTEELPGTPVPKYRRRTRANLKVQDGCNVFCTFCSIPFTRRIMASRPIEELLEETRMRATQGYREIVVTGVLVGAYGQDSLMQPGVPHQWRPGDEMLTPDLADLLLRLAQVPGIERVRLSSVEPTQITDRLLQAFATEPKLCRHLHIPLQSGDNGVLAAMNRPYTREFYLERCMTARKLMPDIAITADIMVGFPGEDDAAFSNTCSMVDEAGFARAHIFRYSPRQGTPAAEFVTQVPEAVKELRSKELASACAISQQRFIRQFINASLQVLVEGKGAATGDSDGVSGNDGNVDDTSATSISGYNLLSGYTSNYIRVQFTGGSHLAGTLVTVHLTEQTSDGALGEAGGAHFGPMEAPPDATFIPLAAFNGDLAESHSR